MGSDPVFSFLRSRIRSETPGKFLQHFYAASLGLGTPFPELCEQLFVTGVGAAPELSKLFTKLMHGFQSHVIGQELTEPLFCLIVHRFFRTVLSRL